MERTYRFCDLLEIFYVLRLKPDVIPTKAALAEYCGVSLRTVNYWFSGKIIPNSADIILKISDALGLTPEYADMLLFAVNPEWIRYGTPIKHLRSLKVVRPREYDVDHGWDATIVAPSIPMMEQTWQTAWEDDFVDNHQRWGLGMKDDGTAMIKRSIVNQQLVMHMTGQFHAQAFWGADSNCFAPSIYYMNVEAKIVEGDAEECGYVLIFNELNDQRHAIFRIREYHKQISVVQTFEGKEGFEVYINRQPTSSIKPSQWNKIAILAIHQQHWFYINDRLINKATIPRYDHARLDLGATVCNEQSITVAFRRFVMRVPPLHEAL